MDLLQQEVEDPWIKRLVLKEQESIHMVFSSKVNMDSNDHIPETDIMFMIALISLQQEK